MWNEINYIDYSRGILHSPGLPKGENFSPLVIPHNFVPVASHGEYILIFSMIFIDIRIKIIENIAYELFTTTYSCEN
jgi:hypothetical protein